MKRLHTTLVILILVIFASPAHSAIIASQDFEGNPLAGLTTTNVGFPSGDGLTHQSGTGLGWTISHENGGPLVNGTESSDLIGVVDMGTEMLVNGLEDATGITGNWFHVEDSDGLLSLTFATVDATNFANLSLDFSWAHNEADYEGADAVAIEDVDMFDVSVNGASLFNVAGDALDGPQGHTDAFLPTMLNLSAFDQSLINIVIGFRTDDFNEQLGFDNLVLNGDPVAPVPTPSAMLLMGTGLFGIVGWRWWSAKKNI